MKKILLFVLLTIIFAFSLKAQTKKGTSKSNSQTAVNQVQDLYFKRDFEKGSELAKKLLEKYPDNLELKAWYVINLARTEIGATSLEIAEKFVKENGESLWTLLPLTSAQTYNKAESAVATGEKLIRIAPNHEDAIFAYNSALFQNKKYKESTDWLEKKRGSINNKSRFLTALASTTYFVEKNKEKGQIQLAFDLYAQAVKLNPLSVDANYLYGNYLTRENKFNEAIPFLQKAAQLSPNGAALRDKYWRTIESQTKKTDEQKKVELERAISQYLMQTKNSPEALLAAWNKYRDWTGWKELAKPDDLKKRDYFEKQIRQKYPNTKYDEEIAFTQIRSVYGQYFAKDENSKYGEIALKKKSKRTPEESKDFEKYKERSKILKTEEIALRRVYLKRPKHFDKEKLGQVYLYLLYQLSSEKDSRDEEISDLLKGSLEFNKNYYGNLNSYIAGVLFNRQKEQPNSLIAKDAEKYARFGINEAENKIKKLPKDAKPQKIYELQLEPTNILADVLMSQEKLDEAEKLLLKASAMKDDTESQNFILEYANRYTEQLWAKLYTAKKDWAKAEEFYLKTSNEDEDVIKETFEKFYEKKTGKKDGFAEYFAEIQQKLKIIAKEKVAQSRIKAAKEMIPFSLKTIEDKTVSSVDLKGKVVVINVWGVWCGPCVAEMPELQKVYDKYKDDKDVAVLTLDTNDQLPIVKKFIAEKKYTLPVLIDENYVDKLAQFENMRAYPTTLFIDKSGKVSFVVVGASSELFESFSWRIDALKAEK